MAVNPIGTSDGKYYESPFHMELEDYKASSTSSTMPPGASTELAGALESQPPGTPTGGIPQAPVQEKFEELDDKQAERLLYDTGVMSSKFREMPASDIDASVRLTQEELDSHFAAEKKAWGDNMIGDKPFPAGRVRIRKDHPAVDEYIKNLPDDVIVHDMKDGTYVFRLKPALTS